MQPGLAQFTSGSGYRRVPEQSIGVCLHLPERCGRGFYELKSMNYEWIKALANQTGRKIPALLALARANDPFFAGCAAQQRDAGWFVEIWTRFGFGNGVHLRRIHYRIISDRETTICPNGK